MGLCTHARIHTYTLSMGRHNIITLPFECQIEILQHLQGGSIELLASILPTWEQACRDITLWRSILNSSLHNSPILDSNYTDKINKVDTNNQKAIESAQMLLENSQKTFSADLQRWKANEELLSRNM